MSNKIADMFNLDVIKELIKDCPPDEIVILCGHWSINQPKYEDGEDPEQSGWDFLDFEEMLDSTLLVSDYDDLIADPHGIYNS